VVAKKNLEKILTRRDSRSDIRVLFKGLGDIMPELAEVAGFAAVVNKQAGKVFLRCRKSDVHKLDAVSVPLQRFKCSAKARGKEMMMSIVDDADNSNVIYVRFG
jgi:hypothetical protein